MLTFFGVWTGVDIPVFSFWGHAGYACMCNQKLVKKTNYIRQEEKGKERREEGSENCQLPEKTINSHTRMKEEEEEKNTEKDKSLA